MVMTTTSPSLTVSLIILYDQIVRNPERAKIRNMAIAYTCPDDPSIYLELLPLPSSGD